ncbi:hypothetical protein U9M48_015555 [Paspalum notatum var. saurae]|uniref:Protein kinase domain-containing protein n=1 Tax=Paspalum notatum var. saurae TaxID=547442 RepID=A0AAQ3T4N6_PASNO
MENGIFLQLCVTYILYVGLSESAGQVLMSNASACQASFLKDTAQRNSQIYWGKVVLVQTSVFKGLHPDSKPVAVKKLQGMKQGEKQFHTEVRALGKIQHINLVCLSDARLFKDEKILDWNTRFLVIIILGVAKRLLSYLQDECHDCIIHCDIKSENVLVGADFSPKLSEFGLTKLMDRHFSRALAYIRGKNGLEKEFRIDGERNHKRDKKFATRWMPNLPLTSGSLGEDWKRILKKQGIRGEPGIAWSRVDQGD